MAAKGIAHAIVADYLHICKELGRPPSEEYYLLHGIYSAVNIKSTFGGWLGLIQAAGYEIPAPKKFDKQEIRKKSFEHLQKEIEQKKNTVIPPKLINRLLCVSDMHLPYGHPDTLEFLKALHAKYNFDHILIGGDELDYHSVSFHTHDPNLLSPGHELDLAIKQLQEVYKLFPHADVLDSNHGSLIFRKGTHHGFPRQVLKKYSEVLGTPNWNWQTEFVYQFTNGQKAVAHHGYSGNILAASKERAMSLIQFHFHSKFSINYWANLDALYFTMQCASLIDDKSLAMAYNKLTVVRPIVGVGAVFNGQPRLFPMLLNAQGRWTGVLD